MPPSTRVISVGEPVLKWAGGKRRLLGQYADHLPKRFSHYHEPFLGGGAVYFWLKKLGRLKKKQVWLSDVNPELVNFYRTLQSRCEELIALLSGHQEQHGEEHYYKVRGQQPSSLDEVSRAARLLYLNRTCFNGLYRENSRGEFNVPIGRYHNPRILDPNGLRAASKALQECSLLEQPYLAVEERAQTGDLVYFDPPYQPLNPTSSFTSYTQHDFNEDDQRELSELFARLAKRKVRVMLSNSDAPLIRELYQKFRQVDIQAARAINSKAERRQKITELLILGW